MTAMCTGRGSECAVLDFATGKLKWKVELSARRFMHCDRRREADRLGRPGKLVLVEASDGGYKELSRTLHVFQPTLCTCGTRRRETVLQRIAMGT